MKVSNFFNNEFVDYASYDNLRKIASIMDGQKNASRKVLYTILEKKVNEEIKVSQLGSKVAEFAEYLHGNLDGVIVNLAQEYAGTNNIPLLVREGNFGTRFSPQASASRYIYTHGAKQFFELFSYDDIPILQSQTFEGYKIEPRFYVPDLPILLINGSEGMSSGFAQKILPRDPAKVKDAILSILQGQTYDAAALDPYFVGFKGTVHQGETTKQWVISGVVERVAMNKAMITEIPVGYDLRSYLDILDALEDDKVINSYRDMSEDDNFQFEITLPSKSLKEWSDEELLTKLKLVKRVSENYTVIDETNKIKVFENASEILDHYVRVKRKYLALRKGYQLITLTEDIALLESKHTFIRMVVNDELVISKRKKESIVEDLSNIPAIQQVNGNYDYLLNMNLLSLTEERLARLEEDVASKKAAHAILEMHTIEDMWRNKIISIT